MKCVSISRPIVKASFPAWSDVRSQFNLRGRYSKIFSIYLGYPEMGLKMGTICTLWIWMHSTTAQTFKGAQNHIMRAVAALGGMSGTSPPVADFLELQNFWNDAKIWTKKSGEQWIAIEWYLNILLSLQRQSYSTATEWGYFKSNAERSWSGSVSIDRW